MHPSQESHPTPQPPATASVPAPADAPPATGGIRLAWSGMTHRGRFRQNNEDAFIALTFDGVQPRFLGKYGDAPLERGDFVFGVSDGMGGAKLGEFASRTAVEQIAKLLPRSFRLSAGGIAAGFQDFLGEVFTAIHRELTRLGTSYEECAGMGATVSLCWFTSQWMYFGHVGDSRIYYLPVTGPMTQITHDHTQVGWLRRAGKINEREARMHPARNSLQQALGAGHQFIDPHIGAVGYRPGDRFLVCSDGLIDGLWDRRIEEIVRSDRPIADLARALVEESIGESGRDNTTAVVVEVQANPA
jgi:protein phosphatase